MAGTTVARDRLVTFKVAAPTADVHMRADVIIPDSRMIKSCGFDFAPIALTFVTPGALTARFVLEDVGRRVAVLTGVVRELHHVGPDVALETVQFCVTPVELHWMRV
jgi:hypothetical protein